MPLLYSSDKFVAAFSGASSFLENFLAFTSFLMLSDCGSVKLLPLKRSVNCVFLLLFLFGAFRFYNIFHTPK